MEGGEGRRREEKGGEGRERKENGERGGGYNGGEGRRCRGEEKEGVIEEKGERGGERGCNGCW